MILRLRFVGVVMAVAWCSSAAFAEAGSVGTSDVDVSDVSKSLIRVDLSSAERVASLKRVLKSWDVAGTVDAGRALDLVVTASERSKLTAAGVAFEVVTEDLKAAADAVRADYVTFPEMESIVATLALTHGSITHLTSIGLSWEGRNIWCLEISDNPGVDEGEVGVVFMALHHAREWPSLATALEIADRLTSGYGSDPIITNLVNNRRIWVIPCVNPDGYVWDHDLGNDWRQNRHPYPGGIGVDLNRNYGGATNGSKDGEWGSIGEGSQTHQQGYSTYCGPAPFSEPETQAMRDFFNAHDVTIALSYHTSGELVLWPWGHTADDSDDDAMLESLGQGIAAQIAGQSGGTYTPQQAMFLYPTTGDTCDWLYGYRYYELGKNTMAYTMELAESYHPPEYQLQQIVDENWDGALYALQQAADVESQLIPFVLPPILSTPVLDADGDFTVSWEQQNPEAGADLYELQELEGLSLLTDGAESGTGHWTMEGFSVSSSRSHSPTHSFKSPPGDEVIAAMTTTDPLPVEAGNELTFWTWYDIELNWDMAFVEVSIDGLKYDILDKFTGYAGGWVQKTYSLDAYAGRSVYLRFRYTTDAGTLEEGFYVDDIYPVASWSSIATLSSSIPTTSYAITGRDVGDYFYRVRGSSPERGFGVYCDLGMTSVQESLADSDADGDRDLRDFLAFQVCMGGDGAPVPPGCATPVAVFDIDLDGDVDLTDFSVFESCFGGPDSPAPPECPF